jgi:alpha-glucoside transport system substrate-binding protein
VPRAARAAARGRRRRPSISGGITGIRGGSAAAVLRRFTKDTGIKVVYTGDKGFEGNIVTKVTGGDAPDLAIVPQPGLLKTSSARATSSRLRRRSDKAVDENWSPDWKTYGTVDGTFYAAPMLANVKGYVWYSPAKFKEWGVEVPKTWDELLTLTKTIQEKSGAAPWCAGFESGDASGWPGTDWIEDLVLRQSGTDVYDKWVAGDVKFTDQPIADAFDGGKILLEPELRQRRLRRREEHQLDRLRRRRGQGRRRHLRSDAPGVVPLVELPRREDGGRQGPTVAPDGDVYAFVLPGMQEGESQVEAGGEFVAAFNDNEATQKVQEFMSSADFANARVKLGGVISANKNADPSLASSEFLTDAMKLLQDPKTTVRFDASDLMPATVGSGSFWKGMVDWIDGKDQATVLSDIQAGYNN